MRGKGQSDLNKFISHLRWSQRGSSRIKKILKKILLEDWISIYLAFKKRRRSLEDILVWSVCLWCRLDNSIPCYSSHKTKSLRWFSDNGWEPISPHCKFIQNLHVLYWDNLLKWSMKKYFRSLGAITSSILSCLVLSYYLIDKIRVTLSTYYLVYFSVVGHVSIFCS